MKKVLFVTYDFPFPTTSGGKNRAYHMLKYSGPEFKKYLYSFIRVDFKQEYKKEMEKIGVEVVGTEIRRKVKDVNNIFGLLSGKSIFKSLYYSKKVHDELLKLIQELEIDIVHFESFYTAFYISEEIKKLGVAQVYGSENIEFKLYEDFAKNKGLLKPVYDIQVDKIRDEEISMYKNSDVTLAVTAAEVEFIKKYTDECYQISNGIDVDDFKFRKPTGTGKDLLFVGNFAYFPNIAAIEDFYKNIFLKLPDDVNLTVIGKKVNILSFNSAPRVELIEFIPDIKDAYKAADILISPIKIGGGTNFKVLEAMAAGVPVIAYEDRSAAIGLVDGKNVAMAKEDAEFEKKLEKLLDDVKLRQKLAAGAREFVEKEYSWKVIGAKLANIWKNL